MAHKIQNDRRVVRHKRPCSVGKLAQRLVLAPALDHLLDAAAREQAAAAAAGGPVVPMDQAA